MAAEQPQVIDEMVAAAIANGVFGYFREVGARTEQYWCPIRHAKRVRAPHPHYRQFDYGDADGYRERPGRLRSALREEPPVRDR